MPDTSVTEAPATALDTDDVDTSTRAERRAAKRSAADRKHSATRAQRAAKKSHRAHTWTPRTLRMVQFGALALVLLCVASAVSSRIELTQALDRASTSDRAAAAARAQRLPLGFAEDCVQAWVESGASQAAAYQNLCQPGSTLNGTAQTSATMTATRVTAYDAQPSPVNPNQYSVRVGAWLSELTTGEDGNKVWTPDGEVWFRVDVVQNPSDNTYNIVGHPYPVAPPHNDDPATAAVPSGPVVMSDPRTAMLSSFVAAHFTGQPTLNYFTPGVRVIPPVPAGTIGRATLVGVGYSARANASTSDATVTVALQYPGGTTLVSTASYTLSQAQGTWTIERDNRTQTLSEGTR